MARVEAQILRVDSDCRRARLREQCWFCRNYHTQTNVCLLDVSDFGKYLQVVCPKCFNLYRKPCVGGVVSSTLVHGDVYDIEVVKKENGAEEFVIHPPGTFEHQQALETLRQ